MTDHRTYLALWWDTGMPMVLARCPSCGNIAGQCAASATRTSKDGNETFSRSHGAGPARSTLSPMTLDAKPRPSAASTHPAMRPKVTRTTEASSGLRWRLAPSQMSGRS